MRFGRHERNLESMYKTDKKAGAPLATSLWSSMYRASRQSIVCMKPQGYPATGFHALEHMRRWRVCGLGARYSI